MVHNGTIAPRVQDVSALGQQNGVWRAGVPLVRRGLRRAQYMVGRCAAKRHLGKQKGLSKPLDDAHELVPATIHFAASIACEW